MIKALYKKHILEFNQASGTSRGILKTKETWFLNLNKDGETGIGECGLFRGLSIDDRPDYEEKLNWVIDLKNNRRGRIKEYADEFGCEYYETICVNVEEEIINDTPNNLFICDALTTDFIYDF